MSAHAVSLLSIAASRLATPHKHGVFNCSAFLVTAIRLASPQARIFLDDQPLPALFVAERGRREV